ncbi:alpha-glucosidase [Anaerosolibacter carboniphilus]|uniref:Alpha-glucosidase n=1 Tax=Anaerosolibacter carboniphilus TaxID=1417629 RepID=A0A841L0B1_9FIRM|nr:TIM-barrel domain-containing protein [Anaerosolibacter carboniphilus]MBB6215829.1 alpha-glucosidase [Anaerosolibacter carboniphilus]
MKTFKISEKIYKYRFGAPRPTEIIADIGEETTKAEIDYFHIAAGEKLKLTFKMEPEDMIWGLGENQRGMNKRGGLYISYCSDDPNHTPDKKSLYGAHNFMIIDGEVKFGVFIDYPGQVVFDIGNDHKDIIEIIIDTLDADVYMIQGDQPREIVHEFLKLIGDGYAPPKWAFGYQQSRWSYPDQKAIDEVADAFIQHDIPCDAIYLDIDYMEDFKDFTISKERFPNFKDYVSTMKEKGLRLVPIIDAGVKIENGYRIYEEGVEKGYFCLDEDGKPFVAAVWPGKVHFPDFFNPEARRWFGLKYKDMIECGIEGFWNDMNEPAIFYSNRGLEKAIEKAKTSENENLDIYTFFDLKDVFEHMSNAVEDYQSFYHNINGKLVNHNMVHNLYGCNMTRAAAEGFREIHPNKRFLLFSRASSIGMHRYGGIWTGDNHSWWEHLLLNLKMMPSLNMCGFLYAGADTGGFSGDCNAQLMIRWLQMSLFTPLLRNHSAMGTRRQEPYAYDQESMGIMREMIRLRYALVPYLYSEYMKALMAKDIFFAPLAFAYQDRMSKRVEDQLLVGESLMIAPIYQENAVGRYVWLPEDMVLWRVDCYQQREFKVMRMGHHYMDVPLNQVPIFIRKNRLLVLGNHGPNIDRLDPSEVFVIGFVEDQTSYVYYDDDGETYGYREGMYSKIFMDIHRKNGNLDIQIRVIGRPATKKIHFDIVDMQGNVTQRTMVLESSK